MAGNVAQAYDVLTENDVVTRLRDRHRDYFLDLAETAEPELRRGDQVAWLDVLEENHDNMRAALEWCLSQGDVEGAARLAGALWRFWFIRGHIPEGRRWLDRVVAEGDAVGHSSRAYAKALWSAAVMVAWNWDGAAVSLVERAEEMARTHGDVRGVYDALLVRTGKYNGPQVEVLFGPAAAVHDRMVAAATEAAATIDEPEIRVGVDWVLSDADATHVGAADDTLHRVLQGYREIGDRWHQMWALYMLSISRGQADVGTALLEEALSLAIELGAPFNITFLSDALCWRAALAGEYDVAISTINFAVDTTRRKGDVGSLAWMLANRAIIERDYGRLDEARATLAELRRVTQIEHPWLDTSMAEEEGDHERARRLAEEAVAVLRTAPRFRPVQVAYALARLGQLHLRQHDAVAARAAFEESMVAARKFRRVPAQRFALWGLGQVELVEGNHEAAVRLIEDLRATFGTGAALHNDADGGGVNEPWWQITTSNLLAVAAGLRGDLGAARGHHHEAVRLAHELGYRPALASALELAVPHLIEVGDAARAARLLGAADALREAISYPPPMWERERRRQSFADARAALGDEPFDESFAAGRAMTVDEAVDVVRSPD